MRRFQAFALVFVVLFGMTGIYFLFAGNAATGSPEIRSGFASDKCIDDYNNYSSGNTKVVLYKCNGTAEQHWTVSDPNNAGLVNIKIHNMCLAATKSWHSGNMSAGNPIVLNFCSADNAPYNQFRHNNNSFTIPGTNLCLADSNFSTDNNHQLTLEGCNGYADQDWNVGTYNESCPNGDKASVSQAKSIAHCLLGKYGWDNSTQFSCLDNIYVRESGWEWYAANASGAYGIPQALPGDKMASAGNDWQTNATTQIKWGLGYIHDRYGTPCDAWAFWQRNGWYVVLGDPLS